MGALFAYLSFRFYHAPLDRGRGWSWGPRGIGSAFFGGVGGRGWGNDEEVEGTGERDRKRGDEEVGLAHRDSSLNGR